MNIWTRFEEDDDDNDKDDAVDCALSIYSDCFAWNVRLNANFIHNINSGRDIWLATASAERCTAVRKKTANKHTKIDNNNIETNSVFMSAEVQPCIRWFIVARLTECAHKIENMNSLIENSNWWSNCVFYARTFQLMAPHNQCIRNE